MGLTATHLLLIPSCNTRSQHTVSNVAGHEVVEHGMVGQGKDAAIILDGQITVEDAPAQK